MSAHPPSTPLPQEPRPGTVALGGLPWLARMIDKARLEAEGTIDLLDLEFPCPMDKRCLASMGNLDAKQFQQWVVSSESDAEILAHLTVNGVKLQAIEGGPSACGL